MKLNINRILERKQILESHPLLTTNVIQTMDDLRIFMSHHVFAVWDFMSLLKTMQHAIVPSGNLWLPTQETRSDIARIINEIVLCEETDINIDGKSSISHFDLYLQAMLEVGAPTDPIMDHLNRVRMYKTHIRSVEYPIAMDFVDSTFKAISKGPHCAAASFCYGRETAIPPMFKRVLTQVQMSRINAPKFHYYLERHIQVDGDSHGPMAEELVNYFCKNDPFLLYEAEQSAIDAINARIKLFDAIEQEIL